MYWDVLSWDVLSLGTFCLCTNSGCIEVENSQEVDSGFCLNCPKKVYSKSGSTVWITVEDWNQRSPDCGERCIHYASQDGPIHI